MSSTSTGRASKRVATLINTHGRLQLRFSFGGKRHYLTLGLSDTVVNRRLAELRAAEIEKDILYERFDVTLEKYKPQALLATVAASEPSQNAKPQLDELLAKYSLFKKSQVSPSTYAKDYVRHRQHVDNLPSKSLDHAIAIRDHLIRTLTPDAAKRCLTQIKACCNWAVQDGLIDHNPFGSMLIKVPKGMGEDADVNPFSKAERDAIIEAFSGDRYYRHYLHYVQFLFYTGCRPSEAIALKWKNIDKGAVRFREAVVVSEDGLVLKEGLKTQRKRDFPITPELQTILDSFRPSKADPEDLLFRSPKGKFIDQHNFANRAWKKMLDKCGIEHRKSYQTRHTFITLCIEAGINSTAIGRWTGTSAKMIDQHYGATNFTNLRPPSLS
jgi:integrase